MAIQPFGYRFDIVSRMPPAEVKAALRSGMKAWFETKDGPRGWIVGPFLCLWRSAFDQYGPMLFGCISYDNLGTRLRGRAGSDLNGVVMFALLTIAMGFLCFKLLSAGPEAAVLGVYLVCIFVVGGALVFWMAHKDRHEAEPLVEFVRCSLDESRPPSKRQFRARSGPFLPMKLTVSDHLDEAPATAEAVLDAVSAIEAEPGAFLILARDEQHFMQTASRDGGFVLEKREGGDATHLSAKRTDGVGHHFDAAEISEALLDYLEGKSETVGVHWERLFL